MTTSMVTGAGSGVGRAVALALAAAGHSVALVGRHREPLAQTIAQAKGGAGRMAAFPCDISYRSEVEHTVAAIVEQLGNIDVLVNCAGTNLPRRGFADLSEEAFTTIMQVNLNGAFHCIQAVLPGMRQRGAGTIVNIVSDAGLRANAKAGPAYVASKFALAGLTESLNAEEAQHGVRACAIFPGDINTPLLDKRAAPPPLAARLTMLQPDDVAACVMLAVTLPAHAVVEKLVVRPRG